MGLKWEEALKGLPDDLLMQFNKMNGTAKQYTANRILGFSVIDSIKGAGSMAKDNESLKSTAKSLEKRNPQIREIIEYAQQHNLSSQMLSEKSELSQSLEAKAQEAQIQALKQATSVMNPQMADSVNFYRRVANGSVKTYKTTEKYDASGKLIERKKEIIDDAETRMRAREKLDRLLGINAIQNLGQVQVGSISINIVDASKKEEDNAPEVDVQDEAVIIDNETIIEREPYVEVEVEKPKAEPKKDSKPKKQPFPAYYIDENGHRRKRK